MYDLIIVGGGPAGPTAAGYAIRKRLNVLLISKDLGGKTNYRLALKILHSRITDWYRRTAVRRRFHDWFGKPRDDEADEEDPMARLADTTSPDTAERVMKQEFTGALQAALRKLPLRQQQAFVLRAWEGFDTAQTAQAMGCSEGSVKTHYSRAIHALQIKLEEFQS